MGTEWAPKQKPFDDMQHELGWSRIFYTTEEDWDNFVKKYARYIGDRPPPKDLLAKLQKFKILEKADSVAPNQAPSYQFLGAFATRKSFTDSQSLDCVLEAGL